MHFGAQWLTIAAILSMTTMARAEPTACRRQDGADACMKKCEARSEVSCAVLGLMYLRGEVGNKPDHAKAEPLLHRACSAKVALGCGALGSLYGVRGDFARARPLFEKACGMGDALSCESLGGIILGADGSEARSDLLAATRKANVYYKRACDLGAATACAFCAAFIVDKIVKGTVKEALELYVKACNGRMALACRQAADLVTGDTPESKALAATLDAPRLAAELLSRACKLGDTNACARAIDRTRD
jgi:hypothetical protein